MFQGNDVIGMETTQIEAGVREIARRAYQFYEERGHTAGHALDDWLDAELWVKQHSDKRIQLQPFEAEASEVSVGTKSSRALHPAPRPTRQIAVGLILLSAAASGATLVIFAAGPHKTPVKQRPSLAEQIALTSGYRAALYNPGAYGH